MVMMTVGRRLELTFYTGFDVVFGHDRCHGVLAAIFTLGEQFAMYARAAIDLPALCMN